MSTPDAVLGPQRHRDRDPLGHRGGAVGRQREACRQARGRSAGWLPPCLVAPLRERRGRGRGRADARGGRRGPRRRVHRHEDPDGGLAPGRPGEDDADARGPRPRCPPGGRCGPGHQSQPVDRDPGDRGGQVARGSRPAVVRGAVRRLGCRGIRGVQSRIGHPHRGRRELYLPPGGRHVPRPGRRRHPPARRRVAGRPPAGHSARARWRSALGSTSPSTPGEGRAR